MTHNEIRDGGPGPRRTDGTRAPHNDCLCKLRDDCNSAIMLHHNDCCACVLYILGISPKDPPTCEPTREPVRGALWASLREASRFFMGVVIKRKTRRGAVRRGAADFAERAADALLQVAAPRDKSRAARRGQSQRLGRFFTIRGKLLSFKKICIIYSTPRCGGITSLRCFE